MSTETNETIAREQGQLDAALSRAQKVYPPIKKNRKATVKGVAKNSGKAFEYDYAYADLADVLTAIMPCLNAEEICVRQPIRRVDGKMYLVTQLRHSSGQWDQDDGIPLGPNNDPQGFSAELSYARRQGLCSMTGAAPEENEDAQVSKTSQQRGKDLAGAQQRTESATRQAAQEDVTPITKAQQDSILAELKSQARKAAQLYEFLGQKPGTPIPARRYDSIVAWLKTPAMPAAVSEAFTALDFTQDEIAQFCTSKGNDWDSILTQLTNMIGAKSE